MLFDEKHLWLLGSDPEFLDSLDVIGANFCRFSRCVDPGKLEMIANNAQAVLVDIDEMEPSADRILSFIRDNHPELPVVICSSVVGYRFVMPFMNNYKAGFLRKPVTRLEFHDFLSRLVSQEDDLSSYKHDIHWVFGLKKKFNIERWMNEGNGALLIAGEEGCGKSQITTMIGAGLSCGLVEINAALDVELDVATLSRQKVLLIKNLDHINPVNIEKFFALMLMSRCKGSNYCGPMIIATATSTDSISRNDELGLMLRFFGDWVVELPPLRERWTEFRKICKYFFLRQGKAHNNSFPVDFSHDGYQALGGHTWPGNLAELESVITQSARCCKGSYVTAECLKNSGWISDGQRNSCY